MVTVEGELPGGDQAMLAIPYLDVFLALLPHIVTTNVIFQKIVGKRLRLNPLAVTPCSIVLGLDLGSAGADVGGSSGGHGENYL
jgi:hypothetical protein